MVNIESVPSEAGPDLDGIEQGISNYEGRRQRTEDRGQRTEDGLRRRAGDG